MPPAAKKPEAIGGKDAAEPPAASTASAALPDPVAQPSADEGEDTCTEGPEAAEYWTDDADAPAQKRRKWPIYAVIALTLAAAGYWGWHRHDPGADAADPALTQNAKTPGPAIRGTYEAFIADQNVTIEFGPASQSLASATGRSIYTNVKTGSSCEAQIMPKQSGTKARGGNAIVFAQSPIDGRPACPDGIPLDVDATSQPLADDGTARSITVRWFDPKSSQQIMDGLLVRGEPK